MINHKKYCAMYLSGEQLQKKSILFLGWNTGNVIFVSKALPLVKKPWYHMKHSCFMQILTCLFSAGRQYDICWQLLSKPRWRTKSLVLYHWSRETLAVLWQSSLRWASTLMKYYITYTVWYSYVNTVFIVHIHKCKHLEKVHRNLHHHHNVLMRLYWNYVNCNTVHQLSLWPFI